MTNFLTALAAVFTAPFPAFILALVILAIVMAATHEARRP